MSNTAHRMKKISIISFSILGAGALGWLAFSFFGIQALFVDDEVKEEIPEQVMELISQAKEGGGGSNESILGKGAFQQGDSTYTISGDVLLSQVDGQLNLTLVDFDVSNGPDLFVYAVKADSTENKLVKETVANGDFVNLGTLKGNIGNQNYVLEANLDPKEYRVISIWCRRFSRNFGSAHLGEQ